jgi:hypothetical protein
MAAAGAPEVSGAALDSGAAVSAVVASGAALDAEAAAVVAAAFPESLSSLPHAASRATAAHAPSNRIDLFFI